jgi:RimJ/RimL family protein N-acetyltransferase
VDTVRVRSATSSIPTITDTATRRRPCRPLLRIAFERMGLHRVVGRLDARNTASARVLEKLGMRREAHLVENEWVKDEWQSEVVFAILDREWRAALPIS